MPYIPLSSPGLYLTVKLLTLVLVVGFYWLVATHAGHSHLPGH
ncbi:MAG TPA: hypothetical protein V6D02_02995 [Candidatus Obscuribacterales bacterium]